MEENQNNILQKLFQDLLLKGIKQKKKDLL